MSLQIVPMFDAIGASAGSLIGNRQVRKVAYYITGSGVVPWSSADVEKLRRRGVELIPIAQDDSVRNFREFRTLVVDVEPGCYVNSRAALVVRLRADLGLRTTLYTPVSNWQALTDECTAHGVLGHVDWGIADWNLDRAAAERFIQQHAGARVVWVQWASPSSNPRTILPGSVRTLAQANVDLSVTLASWGEKPAPSRRKRATHKVRKVAGKAKQPAKKVTPPAALLTVYTALLELAHVLGVNFPK